MYPRAERGNVVFLSRLMIYFFHEEVRNKIKISEPVELLTSP